MITAGPAASPTWRPGLFCARARAYQSAEGGLESAGSGAAEGELQRALA